MNTLSQVYNRRHLNNLGYIIDGLRVIRCLWFWALESFKIFLEIRSSKL